MTQVQRIPPLKVHCLLISATAGAESKDARVRHLESNMELPEKHPLGSGVWGEKKGKSQHVLASVRRPCDSLSLSLVVVCDCVKLFPRGIPLRGKLRAVPGCAECR